MTTPHDKHLARLPVVAWPTASEAARSRWLSPLSAGRLTLADRTWVPAMVPWRASDEGFVTDAVLAWYRRFAEGRPGAIVLEATGIRDVPSGPLLRIGHARFIPGLRELVRTVREASEGRTRLFIQLIDFLAIKRRPERTKVLERFLACRDCLSRIIEPTLHCETHVRWQADPRICELRRPGAREAEVLERVGRKVPVEHGLDRVYALCE